ncbi:response regulator transcription factor [Nocardiopsis sp. HNM0947]|uniref:Response regulator transcription factor n=1 Tax=Nocardiopsis coralli TaxID=2772213 RepID=A0ABR9PCC7_9ACTN|nr:response regulator transcription factor [Nocardiopsis coralli]MBE3001464.1 response regulator transcription factor [Nocardiopsis coralli]
MVRVVLADDETVTREAVAALLDLEEDLAVIGEAPDADGAVALAEQHAPDVALLDLEMPGGGLAALARIRAAVPGTAVCVLTRHARSGLLRQALRAGAAGFVPKSTSARELAAVVRELADGGRHVDPELAADALVEPECPLTERELQVLSQVQGGVTTARIAASLHLAPGTVRNYLSSAIEKLGVRTRYEAADAARESGWL